MVVVRFCFKLSGAPRTEPKTFGFSLEQKWPARRLTQSAPRVALSG